MHLPAIHKTESGKKYFMVNGKRVYLKSKLSKRELMKVYQLLRRKIKIKKATNMNTAKAIVNINNPATTTRRRRRNKVIKINPIVPTQGLIMSTSSKNEDKTNSLLNKQQKELEDLKKNQPKDLEDLQKNQPKEIEKKDDYRDTNRLTQMFNDPRFLELQKEPPSSNKLIKGLQLAEEYGTLHYFMPQLMAKKHFKRGYEAEHIIDPGRVEEERHIDDLPELEMTKKMTKKRHNQHQHTNIGREPEHENL